MFLDTRYKLLRKEDPSVYHLQRYDRAVTDYDQAIQLVPTDVRIRKSRRAVLGKYSRLHDALPYLERAVQLGNSFAMQYGVQARQWLAIEASRQANSPTEIQRAVAEFPSMVDTNFIAATEQVIAQQVSSERRTAFEQRLAWLRQIANEQKQEKQSQ